MKKYSLRVALVENLTKPFKSTNYVEFLIQATSVHKTKTEIDCEEDAIAEIVYLEKINAIKRRGICSKCRVDSSIFNPSYACEASQNRNSQRRRYNF